MYLAKYHNFGLVSCLPQIARDDDLTSQIGKHLFFDLVDHDVVKSYRIQQEVPFKMFKASFSFFHDLVGLFY